jgi:hypothetical protein
MHIASHWFPRQDKSKQRILEILNLEDLSPIYAFAIERIGRRLFCGAASVRNRIRLL